MKDLNKYNTALDLSKLSEDESKDIFYQLNKVGEWLNYNFNEWIYSYCESFLYFDTHCNEYLDFERFELNNDDFSDLSLVDFQTFKQIHFTR